MFEPKPSELYERYAGWYWLLFFVASGLNMVVIVLKFPRPFDHIAAMVSVVGLTVWGTATDSRLWRVFLGSLAGWILYNVISNS